MSNLPNGNIDDGGGGDQPTSKKQLKLEKIYQKKTQLEHVLLRPDSYIGSVERLTEEQWVFNENTKKMEKKELTYVPGLYKIFDEILVNAADNKQRDPSMNIIVIDIKKEENKISVYNNGQGIPVAKHKEENMYIPTMIFGHLLTSSNYNDEEEKVTGGRNGFGAKLCNIYSTKFTVETASSEYGFKFKQTWEENMTKAGPEKIEEFSGKDFTRITFSPDLAKFHMTELEQDIVDIMKRRAFDVAASSGVAVKLNGARIPVNNFRDYISLFVESENVIYEQIDKRWEVGIAVSDSEFQQVSFVNSIATIKGGRHVDYVADTLLKSILEKANKKHKGSAIKKSDVKNHMWLFINCLIVNASFDSQTKENMTTQFKSFGSKPVFSEKFLKRIEKELPIIDMVLEKAKLRDQAKLDKGSSSKRSNKIMVEKLVDANWAGGAKSRECTLILTEGDSAKTLVMSGLDVIGRDRYGVFPLRGKLLNVREATTKQVLDNAELKNVVKSLNLHYSKKYDNPKDVETLRYGKIMIMTDQDQDGSHIKGLVINFIHYHWPLLLRNSFVEEFITPIVKATKSKKELSFFSLPEFEEWKKETSDWPTYTIKYYKGLGTSTSKEAKEYFGMMDKHRIEFHYSGQQDDNSITMAFSKKCVEQRKEWLTQWMESVKRRREMGLNEDYLYEKDTKSINFSDFVNKELVLFSNSDNERSIPNVMDGLKPGQRKVMYTCFKRKDKREVKVAQLAGSVAELSAYHHGETSLMGTIVNLAQDYVGSNNINLLMPKGQFGSRVQGGKDQASPRYIFTQLSPLTKYIFHPDDEPLLNYLYDDNLKIEPTYYVPIIPMVLVNGAEGIGTGWSTKIPNHNPKDIINNIRRMLNGEEPEPMKPWYKNFKGSIEPYGANKFIVYGELSKNDGSVEITELPVGMWTDPYRAVLESMLPDKKEKKSGKINDFRDYCSDINIRFIVDISPNVLETAEQEGLHKFFKLQAFMHTSQMVAFDAGRVLQKYDSAVDVLKDFFKVRLDYYKRRKEYMEGLLQAESCKLSNKARFILEKCEGQLTIENKKRMAMVKELQTRGYDPDPVRAWELLQNKDEILAEENETEETTENEAKDDQKMFKDYDYLLGMAMWSLTLERKNSLLKSRDEKMQEYNDLQSKSPESLWLNDLDELEAMMIKEQEKEAKEAKDLSSSLAKNSKKKPAKNKAAVIPAFTGERVVPKLDADSLKKLTEKPKVKRVTKKKTTDEDKDELDDLGDKPIKSLKDSLGNSPEMIEKKLQAKRKNLKQSKLTFTKDSPKKKKPRSYNSDNGDLPDIEPEPVPERVHRKSIKTVKYNFLDDTDEDFDGADDDSDEWNGDDDFRVNRGGGDRAPAKKTAPSKQRAVTATEERNDEIVISDTDSEFEPASSDVMSKGGSEAMFDSLLSGESDSKSKKSSEKESAPNTKAPAVKSKRAAPVKSKPRTKRTKKDSSDSEDFQPSVPKKRNNDDEDSPEQKTAALKTSGRKRKVVARYVIDSDDDDDDDDDDFD